MWVFGTTYVDYLLKHERRMHGWNASRFSFNTGQGRCAQCGGQGLRTLEMSFLPDVKVLCASCNGMRFNHEILTINWQGKNIGEIMKMDVVTQMVFFCIHSNFLNTNQLIQFT